MLAATDVEIVAGMDVSEVSQKTTVFVDVAQEVVGGTTTDVVLISQATNAELEVTTGTDVL